MRKLVFMILLGACGEQGTPELMIDDDRPPIIHTTADAGLPPTPPPTQRSELGSGLNPETDVCRLLPADDSACAHACDPVALKAYIPRGTCASFNCTLTDGSLFRIGGCNT